MKEILKDLWPFDASVSWKERNRILDYFRQAAGSGGYEICTEFTYEKRDKPYNFKTFVQYDADTYTLVPDITDFPGDAEWRKCYSENYRRHQQKIYDLLSELSISAEFWQRFMTWPLFVMSYFNMIFNGVQSLFATGEASAELKELGINVGIIVFTHFVAPFLKKAGMKLVTTFAKRKIKKMMGG